MRSRLALIPLAAVLFAALAAAPASAGGAGWLKDYKKALLKARKEQKKLLIEFSISDICPVCKQLNKDIFKRLKFKKWAREKVILLHIDFPQKKRLPKKRRRANEEVRKKFKVEDFPAVLIVDAKEKVVGTVPWTEEQELDAWLEAANDLVTHTAPVPLSWHVDLEKAQEAAKKAKRPLLVSFTGSDWCHWCEVLQKEVLGTGAFRKWAANRFVMLRVDFKQKTPVPPEEKRRTEDLLRRFQVKAFPTVLFVDPNGRILAKTGYVKGGAAAWIAKAEALLKGKLPPPAKEKE